MIIQTQHPGIYVSTASDDQRKADRYAGKVNDALGKISSRRTGNELLSGISSLSTTRQRKLTIREVDSDDESSTEPVLTRPQIAAYRPEDFDQNQSIAARLANGATFEGEAGCSAIVSWNPKKSIELSRNGSPKRVRKDPKESFVVLAHEMIHARHIMAGTSRGGSGDRYDETSEAGQEELRAVGLGAYAHANTDEPTENSIRAEHGLRARSKYKPRNA
ncbi:type III secretion system effector protein [Ralstonia syzygii]|uniref:Type III secretion system effector protein n=1 Tax=Ralstonia syzygii TaxID=28097 RepID=A0ABX7ZAW8_9RALS|nr:type III secretion system effector protein [Ralstonia syzygii]QUP52452.1 type III secretion system effector protein [Ralstonia syzygii]